MNTTMYQPTSAPVTGRHHFITPLTGDALLDPGAEFPRSELTRRILSLCWRDCCLPASFSRAPAPVIQVSPVESASGSSLRVAAWWLLPDGIIADADGPYSERLRPYVGGVGRTGQLWPRYEFSVVRSPSAPTGEPGTVVEIAIFPEPMITNRQHVLLVDAPDGRVRIVVRNFQASR